MEKKQHAIKTILVPLYRVEPRTGQPRTVFDDEALSSLADSIAVHGLIQPVTVRPADGGYYQIIAGERRWRASRMAGLHEIPVNVIEADESETSLLSLIENIQRMDLNPIEEARAYKAMMDAYDLTQEEVAAIVGKPRPTIANALRLLSLAPEVVELLEQGRLLPGHAKYLLNLRDGSVQLAAAQKIIDSGLTVRQASDFIEALRKKTPAQDVSAPNDTLRQKERILSDALKTRVAIKDGKRVGRIVLEYGSADEREALLEALGRLGRR